MSEPPATMRIANIGRLLCLGGAALGALGLFGAITGTVFFTTLVPGRPSMVPNTALALLLTGVAGALRHRQGAGRVRGTLSLVAASVVLVIGVGTLAQYALSINLGIDQLLSIDQPPVRSSGRVYPGRPSPQTALGLTFLASALLLFDSRPTARARPAEWLILFAGITAFAAILGQLLGAGALYRLRGAPVTGVALPTAFSMLVTSVGLLLERPDAGVMRVATSPGPGGILLRHTTAAAILAPTVLGFIVTRLFTVLGVEDFRLLVATLIAVMAVMGLLLLTLIAVPLNRSHEALEASRVQTRDLVEKASDGIFVTDVKGRFTAVNGSGCRLLGMSRAEIVGKPIGDFLPPDEVKRVLTARDKLLEGCRQSAEWHLRHKSGVWVSVEVSENILADGCRQSLVRDITERKAAEEESRRSRARIEGIISIATDAIISFDEEQRITIFNRGAEQIFGWSESEAVGQPMDILIPDRFRMVHRAHVSDFAAEMMHARKMGERDRPIHGLRKDGTEFPAEAAISKLQIGDEITFTIVLRDTTERGRLERELRDARSFLENVLESATEYSIVALDLDRRIVLWNEGARRSYGYSAQEIEGTSADGLHVPSDIASGVARSLYARALDQGSAEAMLFRRHKNGSEFLAHVVVSRRIAVDGEPSGYLLISRDVTREHRRSEQQRLLAAVGLLLTSSLDRMLVLGSAEELLVREFADICIVELAGNSEEGQPVEQRKVAHRDPRRTALSLALEAIRLDPQRPHLTWACLQTKRTTLVSHVTLEYLDSVAQNEEHRGILRELAPVSLISVPLTARGLLLGTITLISSDPRRRYDDDDAAFVEDIGRRLALALDNARLFEVATKAIAARDEVMGIVAHDLRNPLGTILMQAALIPDTEPEPGRRSRPPAQTIERAVTRMNHLIQDLLDVTRMEAGHLSVEQARVSACQVVSDSMEAQASLASSASIELRLDAAPELPDVWADRDRLLQVFENLIGNAVKFSQPGGWIVVGAAPREGDVLFWVADTGAGIPHQDLPHVFDRFWQAQKAGRRGAGLGLPIVKGIVEAHGGRIWVESTPDRGSTFFFTIPTASCGRIATGLSTTQPVTRSAACGQNEKGLDG